MKLYKYIILILSTAITACSTLVLEPSDFSWPVESVLIPDDNGTVAEERYSVSFNTKGLFFEEMQDSSAFRGKEIRLIRDTQGFYFITGDKFKNVYVFRAYDGAMVMANKIFISEFGIEKPAFNQRIPFIELVESGKSLMLNSQGISGGQK